MRENNKREEEREYLKCSDSALRLLVLGETTAISNQKKSKRNRDQTAPSVLLTFVDFR